MNSTLLPNAALEYDRREREAIARLPNRAIECCAPALFKYCGYPSRVDHVSELWRFADVMHDKRAMLYYAYLNGLTEREFSLWSEAVKYAAWHTTNLGRRIVPINAPAVALVSLRAILTHLNAGASIFEIGPGGGYLGWMLIKAGFDYKSVDVTQAFHLWQNRFLTVEQMPWWEWIDHKRPDFKVDAIVCNHVLNEMHETALRYLIVRAERMLGDDGVMFVENFGSDILRSSEKTMSLFSARGWQISPIGENSYILSPKLRTSHRIELEERTRDWHDMVKVWSELGGEPNPDDEFADFLEGKCAS